MRRRLRPRPCGSAPPLVRLRPRRRRAVRAMSSSDSARRSSSAKCAPSAARRRAMAMPSMGTRRPVRARDRVQAEHRELHLSGLCRQRHRLGLLGQHRHRRSRRLRGGNRQAVEEFQHCRPRRSTSSRSVGSRATKNPAFAGFSVFVCGRGAMSADLRLVPGEDSNKSHNPLIQYAV